MCLFYPVGSQLDWIEKTGTFKYPVFFKSCKNFRLVQALSTTRDKIFEKKAIFPYSTDKRKRGERGRKRERKREKEEERGRKGGRDIKKER
jgi:hypothetical protein